MTEAHTDNRRRAPRWPADTYASLSMNSQHMCGEAFGAVLDISRGGMRVRTPQPPVKFMKVMVRIALGEMLFEIPCKCVRVVKAPKGNFEVGLSFDPHEANAAAFLKAFAV